MASPTKIVPTPATFFAWFRVVIALYALPSDQITQVQLAQRNKMYELLLADCLSNNPVLQGLTRLRAIGTLKLLDEGAYEKSWAANEARRKLEQQAVLASSTPLPVVN